MKFKDSKLRLKSQIDNLLPVPETNLRYTPSDLVLLIIVQEVDSNFVSKDKHGTNILKFKEKISVALTLSVFILLVTAPEILSLLDLALSTGFVFLVFFFTFSFFFSWVASSLFFLFSSLFSCASLFFSFSFLSASLFTLSARTFALLSLVFFEAIMNTKMSERRASKL